MVIGSSIGLLGGGIDRSLYLIRTHKIIWKGDIAADVLNYFLYMSVNNFIFIIVLTP